MSNTPLTSSGNNRQQNSFSGKKDARSDLGYGKIQPTFQNQRQRGSQFPYVEPSEDVSDVEIDDESLSAVGKKSPNYLANDPYATSDPFYFVGGNTKLSDCFWKIDSILNEVNTFGNSLVAIPGLYKGMGPGLGNSGASFPSKGSAGGNAKMTGSKQGWSSKPPKSKIEIENEKNDLDDIFTLKDLADKKTKKDGDSIP
jgi:hypothetical protein